MAYRKEDRKITEATEKSAGKFLFDVSDFDESQALDMRTRVRSESMMNVLLFYGIMSEGLDSENARKIKGIVERLLISYDGGGRDEAVQVLKQNFPKTREVEKGFEGLAELKERLNRE